MGFALPDGLIVLSIVLSGPSLWLQMAPFLLAEDVALIFQWDGAVTGGHSV